MVKVVGIVGAAGDVGKDLAAELQRFSCYRLILADIKEREALALAQGLGEGAGSMRVDINDPRSLSALCEKCDLIVSTTGPSALVRDKVAAVALQHNLPYVDVGGSIDLYEALSDRDAEIRKRRLCYLISAGFSPGITGTLPRYLMSRRFFERVEFCQATIALQERMTYVATHDMLSGLARRKTPGYWSQGRWVQDKTPVRVCLPPPLGELEAHRVVEAEIREFVEREDPKFFAMNVCVLGELQKVCYDYIVNLGLYRGDDQKSASARFLSQIIEIELRGKQPLLFLSVEARGRQHGRHRSLSGILQPRVGTSFAASCAAAYVRMVAEGRIERKGRCWASEAADPEQYLACLGELGIRPELVESAETRAVEAGS